MGEISVSINGSFGQAEQPSEPFGGRGLTGVRRFSAMESGHAAALADTIRWLSSLMPTAIRLDHRLHAEGATPTDNFGLPAPEVSP